MSRQQEKRMIVDPATGRDAPYPSHAQQWREFHGTTAWLFNPWTGQRRTPQDVGSDTFGLLILPPDETLAAYQAASREICNHSHTDLAGNCSYCGRPAHETSEPPVSESVMPKVEGKPFRCSCGCNVFHTEPEHRYVCNGCDAVYFGE